MTPDLSVSNIFGKTFRTLFKKIHIIFPATFLFCLLSSLPSISSDPFDQYAFPSPVLILISSLFSLIIGPIFFIGFTHFMGKITRGEKTSILNIFAGFRAPFKSWAVYMVFSFICLLGMLCFIVPGIILASGLYTVAYLALDEKDGVFDTFSRSWELTKGYKLQIFLNTFLMYLMIIALMFCVMIVIMIPFMTIFTNNPSADMPLTSSLPFILILLIPIISFYSFVFAFGGTMYNELRDAYYSNLSIEDPELLTEESE